MRWVAITLQVVLSLLFLFSAFLKLTGAAEDVREHLGIAPWFWTVTALVEIVGAAGLLAGIRLPRLAVLAGLWLAATMVCALPIHLLAGDPPAEMSPAAVLLVLTLAVAGLRWRAARIGALLPGPSSEMAAPTPAGR